MVQNGPSGRIPVMNDARSLPGFECGSGFWASGQIPGVRIHGPIRPVLDGSGGIGESEQSAGTDHPECFIQQFQIHRVDLQHPPPGVTHNQTGHVMQAGSEGAGPIAVPLETEGHAQENQQVTGNHIQVQIDRIGPECTAGQRVMVESSAWAERGVEKSGVTGLAITLTKKVNQEVRHYER